MNLNKKKIGTNVCCGWTDFTKKSNNFGFKYTTQHTTVVRPSKDGFSNMKEKSIF